MAHLLPSGYTASYDPTIDHAQYAGEYLEPQETRASYSEDYYYAQNQPVYDATGHWQPSDQYNAEQDLADRYLNLQSAPSVASLAPWQAQGAVAEPYVQAYQGDDLAGSAATAVYWEGQHQSYSQAFPHQNTDDGPIHYPHHATHSQSPVHDPARYPYPAAQGYGFESTDSTPAASGDATSPQPVDQHDWGNSSRSGHGLESRLDFGHFQAPKYEASSAVQAPAPTGQHAYTPLVPPTSSISAPSPGLPFAFVPSQPRTEAQPEIYQPSFYDHSQTHQHGDELKGTPRDRRADRADRRAGRAVVAPYWPTEDAYHQHSYERPASPIMDHLPFPDDPMQQGSPYSQQDEGQPSALSPDPPVVYSQHGLVAVNELGLAQYHQAIAENCRQHNQHANGGRTYLPDEPDLPPAPQEDWARAVPTRARPHPLNLSRDGYHPLVKPEPVEHAMSTSPTPADKRASAESPSAGAKPASTTAKKVCEKKPVLACLFCRGRKIACGPPLPGSKDKTCNQCARRHLKCVYPTESRRGQRKRAPKTPAEDDVTGAPTNTSRSSVSPGSQTAAASGSRRKSRAQSDRPGGGT